MNSFVITAMQDNGPPSSIADVNTALASVLQNQAGCNLNGTWVGTPQVTQTPDSFSLSQFWGQPATTTILTATYTYDLPAGTTDQAVQTCIKNILDAALALVQPVGTWQGSVITGAVIGPAPGQTGGLSEGSSGGISPAPTAAPPSTIQQITYLLQVSGVVVLAGVATYFLWPTLAKARAKAVPKAEIAKARSRRAISRIQQATAYDDFMM